MIYKVIAKQTYYVCADTPEQASMFFINDDDEHVEIGITEITEVEEVVEE